MSPVQCTRRRRSRAAACAGVALTLGLAACSNSAGSAANTSPGKYQLLTPKEAQAELIKELGAIPAQSGQTTRGIVGHVIRIGGVGTDTVGGQHVLPGLSDGARARFARANREGGINGYTFDYVGFADDAATPDKTRTAVQDLVEGQKVFAIVPYAPANASNAEYLNSNRVPYFGWLGQDYCGWQNRPYAFSIKGESQCSQILPGKVAGSTTDLELYLKASGKKPSDVKLAIFGTTDPYVKPIIASAIAAAKTLGITVVKVVDTLPSSSEPPLTDYSPIANTIINSGANATYAVMAEAGSLGVTQALKAAGYTGDRIYKFSTQSLLDDPTTASVIDGGYGVTEQSSAAFGVDKYQQVTDDLKAIGSTADPAARGTYTSYWAADLFLQALAKVQGPLTAEKLANMLNVSGLDAAGVPGLTCPQTWPAGKALEVACGAAVQFDAKTKSLLPKVELGPIGSYIITDAN
jgi:branched-chain amino acid transport system substrate-binding protein